jgi:hypothetical protein
LEEYKLRVFGIGVRRKMFGPKREELTGDWRELHNDVMNCSLNMIIIIIIVIAIIRLLLNQGR